MNTQLKLQVRINCNSDLDAVGVDTVCSGMMMPEIMTVEEAVLIAQGDVDTEAGIDEDFGGHDKEYIEKT